MRPLSRLLSVFIALIMMGLSFLTVSAHEDSDATGNSIVRVTVDRTDDKEQVYPGDELEFTVIVELLLDHTIGGTGETDGGTLYGPDYVSTNTDAVGERTDDDKTDVDLSSTVSYIAFEDIKYKVRGADLGNAAVRTATLNWTFRFQADAGETNVHGGTDADQLSSVGSVDVEIMERPGVEGGVAQLTLDFSDSTAPTGADIERGAEVTFKLTATTGDYIIRGKTLVIKKQLYDEDGDEDGNLVSVSSFAIPELDSNSESSSLESAPKTYKLLQSEVDMIEAGGKLEFSYSHVITENDVFKAGTDISAVTAQTGTTDDEIPLAGDRIDLDSSDDHGIYGADDPVYDSVKLEGTIVTVEMELEPEATPSPYLYESDAAKVMEIGGGTAIVITRTDTGATITLTLGNLSGTGALLPRESGYIRDESRGQTYAVVRRASDGMVVRVWISSASEWVPHIEWANVIAFYNVPSSVLNVIPLDGSMPEADQLVDVAGDYYVYRDNAWRHIPNLSTFRAEGFRWCDLTTATADHPAASSTATPLPSRVGPPAEGYPACG